MGMRGAQSYLTEVVMEQAEEADEAVLRLVRTIAESIADSRITPLELVEIRAAAEAACREVREVVTASEGASIAQRIADNVMRGRVADSTRERARQAGVIVPTFTIRTPRDAA